MPIIGKIYELLLSTGVVYSLYVRGGKLCLAAE